MLICQLQCVSKGLDTTETFLWVFSQCSPNDLLNRIWNPRNFFAQRWRRNKHLLAVDFGECTMKRKISGNPFVNDNPKRILVACNTGPTLELLRSHVGRCTNNILHTLILRALDNKSDAEITEQYLIMLA